MLYRILATPVGILLAVAYLGLLTLPISAQQPVVVELFTSEGCSSCPPADAMLVKLSHERETNVANLILLEEHVEYWNGQGWDDRFSGADYTQRQYDYVKDLHLKTAYTPQIVIDGRVQASGNDPAAVQQLILQEAKETKPVTVTLHLVSPGEMEVAVDDPSKTKSQILFAITEDNLTTKVTGGENGGHTLNHSAVVRELHRLGATSDGKFEKTVSLKDKSNWKKENLRAIVLVQNPANGAIIGAAQIPYPTTSPGATGR